ncbi:hypothetical protein [Brachyspira sp.]|uniref:hypothetical protein n=1 Tax=Brachyspira sp. TaxID=1977261 RepID=UPI002629B929|nr:hypothetical protein [Brachyspira sp.]
MNISLCIENFKIDNYNIKEKEINIYPITVFSNDDNYLLNLIWYINNCHFFEFYRINDYELLSISKIISGIMENYQYQANIDNNMILECIDFTNDIIYSNKNKIISKIFIENKNIDIEKIYLKPNSNYEININSNFETDEIINIIISFEGKSFLSKIFFSRKIDIFMMVLENILKILLNKNISSTLYIADYNFENINLDTASKKNMPLRDFIFKINEISQKENLSNIKTRFDLIKIFMKYYNHNIIIENCNEFNDIINDNKNNLLLSLDCDNFNNIISDDKLIII